MKTVILLSRKGGVGKTATAHALGAGLAKRKKRVLFIDADGQANLTLSLKGNEEGIGLYEVLSQENTLKDAMQKTDCGYLVPANEILQAADTTLNGKNRQNRLRDALRSVEKDFDYCIIDTPAALGIVTINCLVAADKVIVPLQLDIYSLQGINRLCKALEVVQKDCGSKARISGFLVTRCKPNTNLSRQLLETLEKIAKNVNARVYESKIRECNAIMEAALNQTDIYEHAPRSNAAYDYEKFVDEFIKQR